MISGDSTAVDGSADELSTLIARLHETERRVEELTGGEIDSVIAPDGRPFLLRRAQEQVRRSELARESAILNALPANIAVLDAKGVIVAVNAAWRRFASANGLSSPAQGVGCDYALTCDCAEGPDGPAIHEIGNGVRSVLRGSSKSYSLEYPCDSPELKRWYLLTVTPLADERRAGAVVMHFDISTRKHAEQVSGRTLDRLKEAQRVGRIGDWDLDLATRAITWSPEVFEITGRDPLLGPSSDFRGSTPVLDDKASALQAEWMARAISSGESQEYDLVLPQSEAPDVQVHVVAVPGTNALGEIASVHGTIQDVTARKRAHAALEERERELKETQRLAGIGSWLVDFDAKSVLRSEVTSGIFGLTPRRETRPMDELSRELSDVLTPESFDRMLSALRQTRASGDAYETELEIVRSDHSRGWVLSRGEAVRDAGGRIYAMRGTALDITERKRAEGSLAALSLKTEQRERLLSTMLSATKDFVYIFDHEGRFLFVNQPLLDLWGVSLETAVGKTFLELGYPAGLAARLQSQVQEVFATGRNVRDETPFVGADGLLGYYEYIFSPVPGTDGRADFVVGSTRDITVARRVQDELRASNEKFLQLANNITDVFWIRSPDMSELEYVSPAFENVWGRSLQHFYKNPQEWTDFIVPEDRPRVTAAFATLATGAGAGAVDERYRIIRADGEVRWVRSRGFQVRDAEGTLLRNIGIVSDITSQQQAEAELRTSEAEFRTLTEAMPQIVWTSRADGWNTYCNQQWMDYTGLTAEESRGEGWAVPFHPEDQKHALATWQQAIAKAETYSIESRLRRSDGIYRWWLVRGVPLKDADGTTVKWFGTCTDIHDMKLAELEILRTNRALSASASALRDRESEQRQLAGQLEIERSRLVAAQHVAKVGSWETDLATMSVLWSDETHRIFETDSRVQLTHPLFLERVHPDDREEVHRSLLASLDHQEPNAIEHRLLLPDGRIKFVEERWEVRFDGEGKPVRAVGTCQDVTERKTAEIAIQQSQRRLRDIIDGLGPSMFVALLTPDGILAEINRPPLEAVGLKAEDVLGKPLAETWWWNYSPEVQQQLREAIVRAADGEASRYDVRIRGAGDAFIDIDFTLQPLRDESGNVVFLIPSASVITERKVAEGALRQAQKMEAVGQLAAGVAHEFNNILQTLMSMATITRLHGISPEIIKIAGEMEVQLRRGASITQQLVLSSRHQELKKISLDMREQVSRASDLLRRLLPENIHIETETTDDRASIEGDAGQIQQVLLNLAINARDAMPDGGTLTLRVTSHETEVSAEVEDTGSGFDADTAEHLFEPFFTTKEVGKGTGLGLAVVYGIVQQHGGRIEVRSEPGKGSAFVVTLPRTKYEPEIEDVPAEVAVEQVTGRILLVEDEEGVRAGIVMLLELIGYEVMAVGSAEAAMALAPVPVPDLLLSDVSLPGMGGPALARLLRKRWPSLKITLMTGYLDSATETDSIHEGWAILQKPFEMEAMSRHLRTMLPAEAVTFPS